MEEQVRHESTETRFVDNRERYTKLASVIWRDFGPLIVGALVLVLVLVGGWTLFRNSQPSQEPQEVVLDSQTSTDIVLPESTINLSPSPSPVGGTEASPSPSASASPKGTTTKGAQPIVATDTAMTKGGQLPQTGPESVIFLGSSTALAYGFYLL